MRIASLAGMLLLASATTVSAQNTASVQLGPRPFYLVEQMKEGPLKQRLKSCEGPFAKTDFSIGHRGAPLQFPEHTKESYEAAARMGAGVIECDVTFTRDRQLVCRHAQCDLHRTTDILARPELAAKCSQVFSPADPASGKRATAKCCTSDLTLAEFRQLKPKMDAADANATRVEDYMKGTAPWRTDLYAGAATLMTHAESIALIKRLGGKFTPELKTPEVPMPFEGNYTQEAFAQQMIDEYKAAGVDPASVFPQSFRYEDVLYWIKTEPAFGAQAVFLDGRYEQRGFDHNRVDALKPSMQDLAASGVKILAPPIYMLIALNEANRIVPSAYAKAVKAAGLDLIAWSLERDGPLTKGGGFFHRSVKAAIDRDGDALAVLDVLVKQVGVRAVFSDWPATTTFYANCSGIK